MQDFERLVIEGPIICSRAAHLANHAAPELPMIVWPSLSVYHAQKASISRPLVLSRALNAQWVSILLYQTSINALRASRGLSRPRLDQLPASLVLFKGRFITVSLLI